jgi:hypothetical protein
MAQAPQFGAGLALPALGIWTYGLNSNHGLNVFGYYGAAMIALVILLGVPNLIWPATLELDDQGFAWKSWRAAGRFNWSDIESFSIARVGVRTRIGFNFREGAVPSQPGATRLSRTINGFDRAMTNIWKITNQDLAALLNEYLTAQREREALAARPTAGS